MISKLSIIRNYQIIPNDPSLVIISYFLNLSRSTMYSTYFPLHFTQALIKLYPSLEIDFANFVVICYNEVISSLFIVVLSHKSLNVKSLLVKLIGFKSSLRFLWQSFYCNCCITLSFPPIINNR